MQVYLVGGAVRDRLLGMPVFDRDWVVVGATPEQLRDLGYQPVGREFPVFLHPDTKEEHALARTERKSGRGYQGFTFHTDPDVTLEQDLQRRDLTVNAMAEAADGTLIDPYGGRRDLAARLLRHVSPAFAEDPLRVLRVARFAARFAHLGFRVAEETLALMRRIAAGGELAELTAERVWKELERALGEPSPAVFLEVLEQTGALAPLFPELAPLCDEAQRTTLEALDRSARLGVPTPTRFGLLCGRLPEDAGALEAFCERLRAPREYRDAALAMRRWGGTLLDYPGLGAERRLALYEGLDLSRRPERLAPFLLGGRALAGLDAAAPFAAGAALRRDIAAIEAIQPRDLLAEGFKGKRLGEELRRRRLAALDASPEADRG